MYVKLHGVRICLRDWQLSDLDAYVSWMIEGNRWKEFDGPYYALPSAEAIIAFVDQMRGQIERNTFAKVRPRLVITDKESDAFIGIVTWHWESKETFWPTIGIVIYDPAYWGQGRGFEALGLWSDYLFSALPEIVRLDLRTWSGNIGMMRVAEKLGYVQEACFRNARIVKGVYYDSLGYGTLREEWQTLYPQGFGQYLQNPKR